MPPSPHPRARLPPACASPPELARAPISPSGIPPASPRTKLLPRDKLPPPRRVFLLALDRRPSSLLTPQSPPPMLRSLLAPDRRPCSRGLGTGPNYLHGLRVRDNPISSRSPWKARPPPVILDSPRPRPRSTLLSPTIPTDSAPYHHPGSLERDPLSSLLQSPLPQPRSPPSLSILAHALHGRRGRDARVDLCRGCDALPGRLLPVLRAPCAALERHRAVHVLVVSPRLAHVVPPASTDHQAHSHCRPERIATNRCVQFYSTPASSRCASTRGRS
jgi:hypothetical protein